MHSNTPTNTSILSLLGLNHRTIMIDEEPWFVASDICRYLEMDVSKGAGKWLRRLDEDQKQVINLNDHRVGGDRVRGNPNTVVISESGFYLLVFRSNKPEAKRFADWVCRVVLPAIRRDGTYVLGEEKVATGEISEEELVLKVVGILQKKVDRLAAERDTAIEQRVEAIDADFEVISEG